LSGLDGVAYPDNMIGQIQMLATSAIEADAGGNFLLAGASRIAAAAEAPIFATASAASLQMDTAPNQAASGQVSMF
jgi:hypothetical protein